MNQSPSRRRDFAIGSVAVLTFFGFARPDIAIADTFVRHTAAECEVADSSPAVPTTFGSGAKVNRSTTAQVHLVCPLEWTNTEPELVRVWIRSIDRNCDQDIVCTPSEQFLDAFGVTHFRNAEPITTVGCGTNAQESGSSPDFSREPANRLVFCTMPPAEGTRHSKLFTYVAWRR